MCKGEERMYECVCESKREENVCIMYMRACVYVCVCDTDIVTNITYDQELTINTPLETGSQQSSLVSANLQGIRNSSAGPLFGWAHRGT